MNASQAKKLYKSMHHAAEKLVKEEKEKTLAELKIDLEDLHHLLDELHKNKRLNENIYQRYQQQFLKLNIQLHKKEQRILNK